MPREGSVRGRRTGEIWRPAATTAELCDVSYVSPAGDIHAHELGGLGLGGERRGGAGGEDCRRYLAEADAGAGGAGGRGGDRYRVAVMEEGPRLALDRDRLRAAPGELDERAALAAAGPETVPEANRSPVRVDAPFTVMCASIWAGDQYMVRYGGRETTSPFHSTARSMSRPQCSVSRRYGSGSGSWPGSGTRAACSAASGTTHGDTEVANDLPRCGPRGTYSQACRSRADQSLTRTAPKTWSANALVGTGVPRGEPTPTTNPSSASMSSRITGRTPAPGHRSLALAGGADDAGAGDDDRPGPAVVADRKVLPVGHQRLGVRPEEPAEVGRVVLGRVEVDVVGDLERQPQFHLAQRVDRAGREVPGGDQLGDPRPGRRPARRALRHERVERGAANTSSRSAAARSMTLSATRTPTRAGAAGREHPVRQVVQAEQRPFGDLDRAHRATPLIPGPFPGGAPAEPCHRRWLMSRAPCRHTEK